jgi:hypothetical protein
VYFGLFKCVKVLKEAGYFKKDFLKKRDFGDKIELYYKKRIKVRTKN